MLVPSETFSQELLNLAGADDYCSFFPQDEVPAEIYSFESSDMAKGLVDDIMSTVGLVPRFKVLAGNVPNAAAVIKDDNRYIIYSENWVQRTVKDNKWGAIALLSHEIAHHLNGHTLASGGSRPPTELEADMFSGFSVAKLGGNLEQAQWLFRQFPSSGSTTHPATSARLEAVAVGWRDATKEGRYKQPDTETTKHSGGMIFPHSSAREISVSELSVLSKKELRLARNEIFARNGRHFKSEDLRSYFLQFDWYQPYTDDVALSSLEKRNIEQILKEEARR